MAEFQYEALTQEQRVMRGVLEADSLEQATQQLRDMQLHIVQLEKLTQKIPHTALGYAEFRLFHQQLTSITQAGVPLERALRELSQDLASSRLCRLFESLADELERGIPLEQVLEKYQRAFPPMYRDLISAGLKTGQLGSLLSSLNRHLDLAYRTQQILFQAGLYPLMVLLITLGLSTGMLRVSVPAWQHLHQEFQGKLSWVFKCAYAMNAHLGAFWLVVVCVVLVFGGIWGVMKRTPQGRFHMERIVLRLPLVGHVYRTTTLARFADAMGLLVGSGYGLPGSLRLSAASAGGEWLKRDCERWAEELEKGKSLEEGASVCTFVPGYLVYSMQWGVQRNELQDSLYHLARMYVDQVHAMQGRLQTALLPFLLLVVGVIVGVLAVALLSPYFHIFLMDKTY